MSKLASRLAAILFGLALSLAALEIFVRVLHIEKDTFWEPHSLFGWFHISGKEGWWFSNEFQIHVRINSKGLRNRETSYDKPEGITRILILGDSLTEGIQVPLEDTFAFVLETLLNAEDEQRFEVINGGVAHYGTDNAVLFYENEGYKYDPDIVLLAFFTTNDVVNNSRPLGGSSPYFVLDESGQLRVMDFTLPLS